MKLPSRMKSFHSAEGLQTSGAQTRALWVVGAFALLLAPQARSLASITLVQDVVSSVAGQSTASDLWLGPVAGQSVSGSAAASVLEESAGFWHWGMSSIAVEEPSSVPVAIFELLQNSPNPFNPLTAIRFSVPSSRSRVPVTLRVFDIAGRLIRVLADGVFSPGPHSVLWDGRDEIGREVGSGVYFYQLRTAGQANTKRLVLIR